VGWYVSENTENSFYEELLQLSVFFWIWASDNEQKSSASFTHW